MRIVLVILFTMVKSLLAEEPFRVWTNQDGRTIQARYIDETKGMIRIRRTDGRVFKIPLDNLSEEDRKYVKSLTFDQN